MPTSRTPHISMSPDLCWRTACLYCLYLITSFCFSFGLSDTSQKKTRETGRCHRHYNEHDEGCQITSIPISAFHMIRAHAKQQEQTIIRATASCPILPGGAKHFYKCSERISQQNKLNKLEPFEQVYVWLAAKAVRNCETHMSNAACIELPCLYLF